MAIPNVTFIRPELRKVLAKYRKIRDVIEGEERIKECGTLYLPMPNAHDKSPSNIERFKAYLVRAIFYNVTGRTLIGLVGQIFMRDPVIKVPPLLDSILKDVDGSGVTIEQQMQAACDYTCAYARGGLLIDYPSTNVVNEDEDGNITGATVEQLVKGEIRATITLFSPWQIVNWRKATIGAKTFFTLIVISEAYCVEDDGFEMKEAGQFRVLKLDQATGNYIQEIWRENTPSKYSEYKELRGNYQRKTIINMIGADGTPLKEIPFTFVGGKNNDANVDMPHMSDMANINIGLYRNSADYEESCFMVGQPTPVITGLTNEWIKTVFESKPVTFGSRAAILLPASGDAKLIQATENTMLKEAMEDKINHMISLGAKLIQPKDVQRTAFEVKTDTATEGSVLSSVANNVSAAYTFALNWCAKFMGAPETCEAQLNNDFDMTALSPEQQTQVMLQWAQGGISFTEMRKQLKKAGTATDEDATAKAEIDADSIKKNNEAIRVAKESKPQPVAAAA